MQEGGIASIDLRKADLEVLTTECNVYGSQEYNANYMVCAGSDTTSPCSYDEGSPLLQFEYIVGIVSRNQGCNGPPFTPTLFTRLTSYYAWILRNAGQQPPPLTTVSPPVFE